MQMHRTRVVYGDEEIAEERGKDHEHGNDGGRLRRRQPDAARQHAEERLRVLGIGRDLPLLEDPGGDSIEYFYLESWLENSLRIQYDSLTCPHF